jgi:hypothetical protein
MLRSTGFRAAVLLIAFLVAATPAAIATPRDPLPRTGGGIHQIVGTVWEALKSLFTAPITAAATACGESGSIMDPNGCSRAQASSDSGSIMDPDG